MKKQLSAGLAIGLIALGLSGCSEPPKTKSGIDLTAMDTSVRPQDDFFRYVNGTWLKNTEIPADKSRYGTFGILYDQSQEDLKKIIKELEAKGDKGSKIEQKISAFYNSYLDTETINSLGIKPLTPLFDEIDSIDSTDDLAAYFGKAPIRGGDVPFGIWVNQDVKDSIRYTLYMSQSGLGLPDRDYYLKDNEKFAEIRDKYKAHLRNMLSLAGLKEAAEQSQKIYELEYKLAEIQWTRVDNRDSDKTYNKYFTEDLSKLSSSFNWKAYLQAAKVDGHTDFIVRQPTYMSAMAELTQSIPLSTWKNYLKWQLLGSHASKLSADFDAANFEFYGKTLRGAQEQQPRWKRAISGVNGVLGEALGQVYVAKHFKPEAKDRMVELVENLKAAYAQSIKDLDWMGEETKTKALDKLNKFVYKIGYPDKWKDYSDLNVSKTDLLGNYLRANEWGYNREINKLGKPIDRGEWFMTPQTVNAYYNPPMNEIVFPASILQPPFFDLEAEDAVNYGAIGAVIGHEFGHGFDDQGSKYNGEGNLKNWWTDSDREEFKKRTHKLIAQYAKYEPLPGMPINGQLTLGENIGDLGGLSIAYKAYKLSLNGKESPVIDGFTGDQRFFMGWAQGWRSKMRDEAMRNRLTTDPHSPAEYRVLGVVANIPAFHAAFEVKEGDLLYRKPEDQVKIW